MNLPLKYVPLVLTGILCLIIALIRYSLLPDYPVWFHFFGFLAQYLVIYSMWQLVGVVNRKLEKRLKLEDKPGKQIFLQVAITYVLLSPVFFVSYYFGRPMVKELLQDRAFNLLYAIFFIMVLFLIFAYYTYALFTRYRISQKEKTDLLLAASRLEREKTLLQYHHLKNQVNPHFLFNAFSALDGLVQSNPELASEFIRNLSKVYRYVLENRENVIVNLDTELRFISHYISLLKARYGDAICFNLQIPEEDRDRGVVMVTLQLLIDNAIKHNIIHDQQPLRITIEVRDGYLYVRNNKQIRKQMESSNGQGLAQLRELYGYFSSQHMEVNEADDTSGAGCGCIGSACRSNGIPPMAGQPSLSGSHPGGYSVSRWC